MSTTPLADELATISKEEFDRYLQQFRPLEQTTIASLSDSTVGQAMDRAGTDAVSARASLSRMRERYGTTTTPDQAAGEARQNALSGSLSQLSAGNNAIVTDRDNRTQTLAGLMNVGGTIRKQALGTYSSASGLESARTSADTANQSVYTQQKATTKNNNMQAGASLAATAAIAAMMM
ncbi:hypothetical protein NL64_06180 [Pseudomonas fluorescens]|uniref:hypothetical protein n=1 Tax=Pseudomonas fluorescens TaxID=294 RepID=UPI00054BFF7E|nr:hypothetical protein [Pseudomonas fluorescens]KII34848.1 hypothetical protein NL64_06180 [Pseudomonas fluorescens]